MAASVLYFCQWTINKYCRRGSGAGGEEEGQQQQQQQQRPPPTIKVEVLIDFPPILL